MGYRYFDKFSFIKIISLLMMYLSSANSQLVAEARVYQHVVEAVHTVFNNTCVIFMYTAENPMQALDLHEAEQLMSIPKYISRLHVRCFAFAVKTFKELIGDSYFNLKRPLFILINDSEDMKKQYSEVIAPWIAMAYINWVIFIREETDVADFFANIYVPLDCIFLVVQKRNDSDTMTVLEVYSIAKNGELIINVFGTWNEEDGLLITKYSLYQRRGDLRGQLLRVTTVEDPPVSLIERDESGNMTGIKGFFGTIVQILIENLNCTVVYTECDAWGSLQPNGNWTGTIGKLVKNESDLAAAELLMSSDRLEAVEFTTPVISTKSRTFIKRPSFTAIKWTAYSDPFALGIWLSMLIIMVLSGLLILLGIRISLACKRLKVGDVSTSFSETFFNICGAVCGQGYSAVRVDSIRIIEVVVHMTGVIVLSAYSAALISFLAVKVFIMPFTSMEGLLNDGSYKFGVVRDSADYSLFQDTSDKILQRMFDEILEDVEYLPNNYLEGLKNVCSEEKYAFMATDNMFAILQHQVPCILEPLDPIMQSTMAMAVPKRSPFRGVINSNILLMRDSGVLQRVIATELLVQSFKVGDQWTSVEIVDVLPLILLIIGGVAFGVTVLIFEKIKYAKFREGFKLTLIKKLSKQKFLTK